MRRLVSSHLRTSAADIEDNKDNSWKQFATEDDPNTEEEEFETPNQKTMSMRAAIKAGVANRLIDGETYKIRMTILRNEPYHHE